MKKVFISHASADEKIVSLFVDKILKAGCGVNTDDIVYTSWEDTGVVNGEDIPEAIKSGIRESALFFMMVSENYRKSEVCLNEMGAAWITEGLVRKIMVLPGAGFDKIGWLMSLKKGTKLDDKEGLDKIHDEVLHVLGCPLHTATWNRSRDEYLEDLAKMANDAIQVMPKTPSRVSMEVSEDECDLLDMRESFDTNMQEFMFVLNNVSKETRQGTDKMNQMARRLSQLKGNPDGLSTLQVRGVMQSGASHVNHLAEVYEQRVPLLRDYFDQAMKYAIMIQKGNIEEDVKKENRASFKELIDVMIAAKDEFVSAQEKLDETGNLDNSYKRACRRLNSAFDGLLEVLSFCIVRANEFRMA